MPEPQIDTLHLREIKSTDVISHFSLGDKKYQPLKNFIRKSAKEFHNKNIAKTYVIACNHEQRGNPQRVWGYITLMCSQIELDDGQKPDDCSSTMKYKDYPAVKIARLAIDSRLQGKKLGLKLIDYSIALVIDNLMPIIGCRFLVVDSKKSAVKYYQQKAGFRLLDTDANRKSEHPLLFLDLHKLI